MAKFKKGDQPWLGKKHSEATKLKMSLSAKKRWQNGTYKHTKEWKEMMRKKMIGRKSPMKGKKHSVETRRKMSVVHKGEKSYLWKGGITKENRKIRMGIEFRLWREAVFARDNYTCQKCQKKGVYLHPHHILNFAKYPELRFAIDNGITFCRECHKKFHKIYGNNNNQEQIEGYVCKNLH